MASIIELRPDEKMFFEGDVDLLKTDVNGMAGYGVVTNQRFVVKSAQDIAFEKQELSSIVEEQTRGFETTLVLRLTDGSFIKLNAINARGLNAALSILTGQQTEENVVHLLAPDKKTVRNGTAWLAAFGPLIAFLTVAFVLGLFSIDWDGISGSLKVKTLAIELFLVWVLMAFDHKMLERQGFNPLKLGLVAPGWTFPLYLFKRAKVFGHSMAYAVTWSILFTMEVILDLDAIMA